jgi:hypothetical protein
MGITLDEVTLSVDYSYAEDSAHVSGDTGSFVLAVRQDTKASTAGTDGDYAALIQDADGDLYVSDTVAQGLLTTIDADTGSIATDASTIAGAVSGTEMQVDIVASLPAGDNNIGNVDIVSMSGQFAEDAAHTTGDLGNFMLAVANHTEGALHDADGDYAALQVDSSGRLRVIGDLDLTGDLVGDDEADTEDPLKVGSRTYDQGSALSAVSAAGDKANLASDLYRRIHINQAMNVGWQVSTASVSTSEAQLAVTPLAGRKKVIIQNRSTSNDLYVRNATGVTTANGICIPKKTSMELELGESQAIYSIATGAATDVRILEAG